MKGARSRRIYDRAQTPYQRLCAAGTLSADARRELEALYQSLNTLQLRRALERELDRLWTLAAPRGISRSPPPPNSRSWRLLGHGSGNPEF